MKNQGGGSLRLTKIQYYKVLDERYNKLYQLENMIEKNYYKPVDKKKLYTSMYKGLFKGLNDPYSEYMTKEEYDNMLKESTFCFVFFFIRSTYYVNIRIQFILQ